MSANQLEQNGKLTDFPTVELLREAASKHLSGTLRFAHELQKVAVYFSNGEVVYAASNLRHHRLVFKLLQKKLIREEETNLYSKMTELELKEQLLTNNKISADEIQKYQNEQATEILATISLWTEGTWELNAMVRAREDFHVKVDLPTLITTAARNLPLEAIQNRFKIETETFSINSGLTTPFNLSPIEAFVFSRIDPQTNNIESLAAVCAMPESQIKHLIYVLWLGDLVIRSNELAAFDEQIIKQGAALKSTSKPQIVASAIKNQEALKEEDTSLLNSQTAETVTKEDVEFVKNRKLDSLKITINNVENKKDDDEISVENFLNRIESAKSHYQILDVPTTAETSVIKQHYFKLAKSFHPDKYHHLAGTETHNRLQNAFSKVAHAYETLKVDKSRELYDFKLRKQGGFDELDAEVSLKSPEEIFMQGVNSYDEGNLNEATAFFSRAVQLSPENSKYHAYYGQALADNPAFRHQAEAELQNAIRLDEKNADWRLLLVDFYLSVGLQKRAVGELNRLLILHPNHDQARQMLADIAIK